MKRLPLVRRALAALLMAMPLMALATGLKAEADAWSTVERAVLSSLLLDRLPARLPDPSNAVERIPAAVALGKRLFFDKRLSANQQVACASCHQPERQFQDGRTLAQGVGAGIRRTMPIADSSRQTWFFWDGRKDSLWSQALGPLEDPNEHGGNRLAYAKLVSRHYRAEYEALFRAMPALDSLPDRAGPNGTAAERAAWLQLSEAQRLDVSRIFANMGKAIAAYEASVRHGPARLDSYIDGTLRGDAAANAILTQSEKRGLRLFIGKAQCITCHSGPLLTDMYFHNTGVAPQDPKRPASGRAAGVALLLKDEFNCLGAYSDAAPRDCRELQFLAGGDPLMTGAFKTPSLRNVAMRPPYMHAGQIATLEEVVRHYAAAPRSAIGTNERRPMALSEQEIADLAGFLGALTGPIKDE